MVDLKLLNEVSKEHDDTWFPLRQLESLLMATQQLPCFISNDEVSMNSFEYVDPILEVCLQKVKQVISQHEEIAIRINKIQHLGKESISHAQ